MNEASPPDEAVAVRGHVYVVTNPAMPDLVKIGVTERQVRVADEGGQRVCIVALPGDEFAPHPANADRSVSEGRVDSLAKITADLFGYEYMSALHHWRLEDGRLLKDVYEEAHAAD
ncbi:MAG: hypothetical protein OXF61_02665 [Acidimicrobiaceae bacterium]|nr:hypothetical protein [Acidimicrobiaceae bacterium]